MFYWVRTQRHQWKRHHSQFRRWQDQVCRSRTVTSVIARVPLRSESDSCAVEFQATTVTLTEEELIRDHRP